MAERCLPVRKDIESCEPCKKGNKQTVAIVYCKQCGEFQCSTCQKTHEVFDFMSGHEIVQADKAVIGKSASKARVKSRVDPKGFDMCKSHGKEFEFFCVDHNTVVCSVCAIEIHRQCREVNTLSTQINKANPYPDDVISILNDVKTRASVVIEQVNATRSSMKTQVSDLPVCIDNTKQKVVQMFDKLKDKFLKEASECVKTMNKDLDDKETKCDEIIKAVEEHMEIMEAIAEKGSPEQILVVINGVGKSLEQHMRELDQHQPDQHDVTFAVEFNQALESLVKDDTTLGKLKFKQQKTTENPNLKQHLSSKKPATWTLKSKIDFKKACSDKEEPFYTGFAFLPDGRIVVIDNNNSKCDVMNEEFEKLGTYKFQFHPLSVVIISDTDIVVSGATTDRKALQILNISLNNKIKLIRTIKYSSKYQTISLMNDKTLIASTFDDSCPIRLISLTGDESDIEGLPKMEYSIGNSSCVFLRNHSILVFSDRLEHEVRMYNVNDNKCVTRCVVKHEDIKEPRAVCPGPYDSVFVCCEVTGAVVQLSLDGDVISSINLDMKFPHTLCLNQNETKLVVSNNCIGAKKLHLYSIK